jgi:hypothetical protein
VLELELDTTLLKHSRWSSYAVSLLATGVVIQLHIASFYATLEHLDCFLFTVRAFYISFKDALESHPKTYLKIK